MYIKLIKKGNKNYKYYHNVKINNKVKNIYLGSSKKEALAELNKLKASKARSRVNFLLKHLFIKIQQSLYISFALLFLKINLKFALV